MAIYDDKWFEVWYTDGTDVAPTYLYIAMPDPNEPSRILILDPFEKNKIVYKALDYEDARNWLCEDEFSLVDGGQFPDDGWPLCTGRPMTKL